MDNESACYVAIARLHRTYADIATRGAWTELSDVATPDVRFSFDTHSGKVIEVNGLREFTQASIKMTEGFTWYELIPLNFVLSVASNETAEGRSYVLELNQGRNTDRCNEFYGVYQDQYVVFEERWRFARRHYQTYGRRTDGRLQSFPLGL
jgi:SnoaL-like domain